MNEYLPHRWVILQVSQDQETEYKVLGGWYGGYLGKNYWRLNSGIVRVERDKDYWVFYGNSGSVYRCHVTDYGQNIGMHSALNEFKARWPTVEFTVLDENTDWNTICSKITS